MTSSKESIANKAVLVLLGFSLSLKTAFVIKPSVPSVPMNNCLRS